MPLRHLLAYTVPDVKSAEYVFPMDYFIIFLPFSRFSPYRWYSAVCLWCTSCVFIWIYVTWGSLSFLDLKFVVFHSFWENLSYYLPSFSLSYSCRTQLEVCLDHFISFHSFWMLLFCCPVLLLMFQCQPIFKFTDSFFCYVHCANKPIEGIPHVSYHGSISLLGQALSVNSVKLGVRASTYKFWEREGRSKFSPWKWYSFLALSCNSFLEFPSIW